MRARLEVAAAALLFSTGGAAVKAVRLTGWQIAGFRSLLAAGVLLLFLPEARRNWSRATLLAALCYASTLVLFVNANKLTSAAAAIFLQATAPLYLLVLGPWILKEHPRRIELVSAGVVALGLMLCVSGPAAAQATAPDPALGNLLGAFSGLTWACTLTALRWTGSRAPHGNPALGIVTAGNVLAAAVSIPAGLPLGPTTPSDWVILAYLGVFQIGLAYLLMTRGVRHVPAFEASMLLLVEPAFNPLWVWLLHGEQPGAGALAGGALILAATTFATLKGSA